MKNSILGALVAAIIAPAALAAEINCSITKTNKYDDSDVATHEYRQCFDAGRRSSPIVSGTVRSHLLPVNSDTSFAFSYVGQGAGTKLEMNTWATYTGLLVSSDTQYGSVAEAPGTVSNSFQAGDYDYEVDCYLSE